MYVNFRLKLHIPSQNDHNIVFASQNHCNVVNLRLNFSNLKRYNSTRVPLDHLKRLHLTVALESFPRWMARPAMLWDHTLLQRLWYYWPQLIWWKQRVGWEMYRHSHQYLCQITLLNEEIILLLVIKRKLWLNDSNSKCTLAVRAEMPTSWRLYVRGCYSRGHIVPSHNSRAWNGTEDVQNAAWLY